jgi:hypothetical protein
MCRHTSSTIILKNILGKRIRAADELKNNFFQPMFIAR